MKYTSRLETCVARRKGVAFNLEVHIGTWHMCGKAKEITHLPHEAVAEVSKDKKPIGVKCEIQLMWESTIWNSIDLNFHWFQIQLIWKSTALKLNCFEIQLIWDSIDFNFNWFQFQFISTSNDLRFNWFENQLIWNLISDSSWKLENEAFLRDFLKTWSFEALKRSILRDFLQKQSFEALIRSSSARLPSKMELWNSKTKLFCETSFKNGASKL